MAGLGRRLLGAALVGAGAGIVEQARNQREDTLIALRRKHQVEDRNLGAELTREGWERADERAGRNLVPVVNDAGQTVYMPQSEAEGKPVGRTSKTTEPLVKVRGPDGKPTFVSRSQAAGMEPWERPRKETRPKLQVLKEDPVSGERTYGVYDAKAGGIVPVGVVNAQGGIVEDTTAQPGESGPSWFERAWSAMTGGDENEGLRGTIYEQDTGRGDADIPADAPPGARRRRDGTIWVPVQGGWQEWRP